MENNKKNNVVVRYENSLNKVSFAGFNAIEINLFFTFLGLMRDRQEETVVFSFEQLKDLSQYAGKSNQRFIADLKNTYDKMLGQIFQLPHDKKIIRFVLFTRYEIDPEEQTVEIAVNKDFKFLINDLTGGYTTHELQELAILRSIYSKRIYQHLKQWRSKGSWLVTVDDFRSLLDIPVNYRMRDIDIRVFNIALPELEPYFKGLKLTKLKATKGNRINSFRFDFEPEQAKKETIIEEKNNLTEEEQKELEKLYFYRDVKKYKLSDSQEEQIEKLERKEIVRKKESNLFYWEK